MRKLFAKVLNFIKREKLLIITFGIFLLALLANHVASSIKPRIVENIYSSFLFKYCNIVWSSITGIFPFSLGEMFIIAAIPLFLVFLTISIVKTIKNACKGTKPVLRPCFKFLKSLAVIFFIILSVFIFSWSINYSREPFAFSAGYKIEDHPVADLVRLCENLAAKANKASELTNADAGGAMILKYSKFSYFARSAAGYSVIEKRFPTLAGHFGRPKPVLFSRAMCYAGTTGIYFPLTGEANINYLNPQPDFLYTICHEMAHQRGFAREDEANFISYLACVSNPDAEFKYAGYYGALSFSMNALYGYSPDDYSRIYGTLDARIRADMSASSAFWKQFEGPIQQISNQVNDTYLKANKIYDGVYSYGRVVDLLLSEQSGQ